VDGKFNNGQNLPSLSESAEVGTGATSPTMPMDSPSVFVQDIDNIEFSPRIPQPSSYVKVKAKGQREQELEHLFLAQELSLKDPQEKQQLPRSNSGKSSRYEAPDAHAAWALAFSLDGKYLAAAGQDGVVKVWSVLSSLEEREEQEQEEDETERGDVSMRASIFRSTPVRVYKDHTGPVWDLRWSKVGSPNHVISVKLTD
jgi:WD40 repeat protein